MRGNSSRPNVLITDFDGTMTKIDFYKLIATRFLAPEDLIPWKRYLGGDISHFQAIQEVFSRLREPEARVREHLAGMEPDPRLIECVRALKKGGWDVVVASAGCEWYVRLILAECAGEVTIFANPGVYREGGPLEMSANRKSAFFAPETGVDKAAIVRHHLSLGKNVAFSGDGFTDEEAAMLAPAERRFAKKNLVEALTRRGASFRPFTTWSEVADALLSPTEGESPPP